MRDGQWAITGSRKSRPGFVNSRIVQSANTVLSHCSFIVREVAVTVNKLVAMITRDTNSIPVQGAKPHPGTPQAIYLSIYLSVYFFVFLRCGDFKGDAGFMVGFVEYRDEIGRKNSL